MAILTMLAARMRRDWTRCMLLVLKMPSSASCMLDCAATGAGAASLRAKNGKGRVFVLCGAHQSLGAPYAAWGVDEE